MNKDFDKAIRHYDVDKSNLFIANVLKTASWGDSYLQAYYIFDYATDRYIFVSPRMAAFIDYPVSRFMEHTGPEFIASLWHKKDLDIYYNKIMPENRRLLEQEIASNQSDLLFKCNYRVKTSLGNYIDVSQESVFIRSAADNTLLAAFGIMHDISEYKTNTKITHSVTRINTTKDNASYSKVELGTRDYFTDERVALLSERELEILKFISGGFNSVEIAEKLYISKHTVDQHRRNIRKKLVGSQSIDLAIFVTECGIK